MFDTGCTSGGIDTVLEITEGNAVIAEAGNCSGCVDVVVVVDNGLRGKLCAIGSPEFVCGTGCTSVGIDIILEIMEGNAVVAEVENAPVREDGCCVGMGGGGMYCGTPVVGDRVTIGMKGEGFSGSSVVYGEK